ncbi:winged helix-turn-helix transcriptional regulator [Halovivax cerinus]|uniref:Winged helix-turn-helix transcriptional regulator n=1 Tax=Halovivax cerinus TaxID=1487865 RepID=A0ABD5NT71_9EURY|nr:winged helix-turn-helix transcriptional regulator [Halovivax cerinus]
MRSLDETDLEIIALLLEDARRPYNDIADRVDVSAPTVSDRIDRLERLGIIQGFTVDIDRSSFSDGIEVLIDVALCASQNGTVTTDLAAVEGIEHVFMTSDARLLAVGTLQSQDVGPSLLSALDAGQIESYRVHLIQERAWEPSLADRSINLTCESCGDDVTENGRSLRFDGGLYHFCDRECRSAFEDQQTPLAESS